MIPRFLESGIVIREARIEDARKLVSFYKKVTSETEFLITEPDEVHDETQERYMIRVYTQEWNRLYLVALDGSKIVGSLKFAGNRRRRTSHTGEMSIAVLKEKWGLGIGTALMEELIEWARTVGILKIELEVMENNSRAIRLYEKFGFQIECIRKMAVKCSKGFCDILRMVKFLG